MNLFYQIPWNLHSRQGIKSLSPLYADILIPTPYCSFLGMWWPETVTPFSLGQRPLFLSFVFCAPVLFRLDSRVRLWGWTPINGKSIATASLKTKCTSCLSLCRLFWSTLSIRSKVCLSRHSAGMISFSVILSSFLAGVQQLRRPCPRSGSYYRAEQRVWAA